MCQCIEGASDHEHGATQDISFSLYSYIEYKNVTFLNATGNILEILRDKYDKDAKDAFIQSKSDSQILVNIPFDGLIKLKSIILEFPDQSTLPDEMLVYINMPSLDFTSITEKVPSQTWKLASIPRQPIEYFTRIAKFSNISYLSLLFQADPSIKSSIQISFIGFIGEFRMKTIKAVNTNYEVKPVLSDHKNEFTLGGVQTKSAF